MLLLQWFMVTFFVWLIVSVLFFPLSMPSIASLQGAPRRKAFWRLSVLTTLYITIPVVGWIVGIIHLSWCAWKTSNFHYTKTSLDKKRDYNDGLNFKNIYQMRK